MPVSNVGSFLRTARERRALTLRAVEEATGVSNAYLSQLETGRIRQPSPVILHKLCTAYGVSYEQAMRLSGYPLPPGDAVTGGPVADRGASRFGDISADEEAALTEYLEFLRARRKGRRA